MAKILVIEDNPNILEEVLIWLELEGFEVSGAANGSTGIQTALQLLPDLIICDIMMPEKDGHRVLIELRANKATSLTPFVFMTAKQEKSDIRYGMELGADDYITKPFSREEFLGAIRSRLERRELFAAHSQQQLSSMRDSLFRSLPHELRTPLVGILGVGELLEQDAYVITPEEILEFARMITVSGQQLYRLIENHLFYVQLEMKSRSADGLVADRNAMTLDAANVIREACNKNALSHHRSNDLRFDLMTSHEAETYRVQIANEHLTKIVYELVDNAFKFSTSPSIVKIVSRLENGKFQLSIHDHGHGITADNLARLGAYTQFDRDKYEQRGSGLGLTIARLLTELYGGQFEISSTPGKCTSVQISLRLTGK